MKMPRKLGKSTSLLLNTEARLAFASYATACKDVVFAHPYGARGYEPKVSEWNRALAWAEQAGVRA